MVYAWYYSSFFSCTSVAETKMLRQWCEFLRTQPMCLHNGALISILRMVVRWWFWLVLRVLKAFIAGIRWIQLWRHWRLHQFPVWLLEFTAHHHTIFRNFQHQCCMLTSLWMVIRTSLQLHVPLYVIRTEPSGQPICWIHWFHETPCNYWVDWTPRQPSNWHGWPYPPPARHAGAKFGGQYVYWFEQRFMHVCVLFGLNMYIRMCV